MQSFDFFVGYAHALAIIFGPAVTLAAMLAAPVIGGGLVGWRIGRAVSSRRVHHVAR